MKILTPIFVLLFVFASFIAQAQQANAIASTNKYLTEYQGLKLNTLNSPLLGAEDYTVLEDAPGQRMIRVGKSLVIGGSVLLVGGIILLATADELYYRSYTNFDGETETEGDIQALFGFAMASGGLGMIIPGAIVWSKGKKKYEAYKSTGASLSLGVNRNGAGLRFRF